MTHVYPCGCRVDLDPGQQRIRVTWCTGHRTSQELDRLRSVVADELDLQGTYLDPDTPAERFQRPTQCQSVDNGEGWARRMADAVATGGLSLVGGSPNPAAPAVEADLRGTYMDPNTPAERFRRPRPTVDRPDDREPKPCPVCGETCKYDGWDHVHSSGLGIGSCRPAAPAARTDLRDELIETLWGANVRLVSAAEATVDRLLAGPLRSLVEQAAEAARLRETVARVEALHTADDDGSCPGCREDCMYCESGHEDCPTRRVLDGTDG